MLSRKKPYAQIYVMNTFIQAHNMAFWGTRECKILMLIQKKAGKINCYVEKGFLLLFLLLYNLLNSQSEVWL